MARRHQDFDQGARYRGIGAIGAANDEHGWAKRIEERSNDRHRVPASEAQFIAGIQRSPIGVVGFSDDASYFANDLA